jgi:hypothetical protein
MARSTVGVSREVKAVQRMRQRNTLHGRVKPGIGLTQLCLDAAAAEPFRADAAPDLIPAEHHTPRSPADGPLAQSYQLLVDI